MTNDFGISINLLNLSLRYSISANRWNALRTLHDNLFSNWNEDTINPYIIYIQSNKELFEEYSKIIDVQIPPLIRSLFLD